MASVTSLDQDMRKLRLDRYTPGAANEIRGWIEEVLGERLQTGDLMEALKDGVALCKLVNLAVGGIRYKASTMPFVQMENISHFLKACEMPPLNLPSHDRFLTVDLYDGKDPAQVLQCIAAFSRRANATKPSAFPRSIGPMSKGGSMSPQGTGGSYGKVSPYTTSQTRREMPPVHDSPTTFNPLNKAAYSGRISPTKQSSLGRGGLASPGSVSSWTNKGDEGKTAPAWNIHQYGYVGGASQGNQGIAFGARRQITSAAPHVPSLAEKERQRKEAAERQKLEEAENEQRLQAQREAEEARAREEEEERWAEETRRAREHEEQERKRIERESTRRDLQEQREAEELEQEQREVQMAKDRARQRTTSDARLNGQFLSQYQSSQPNDRTNASNQAQATAERQRIQELERQLEEMKARELEQQARPRAATREAPAPQLPARPSEPPAPALPSRAPQISHDDEWTASEREYLKNEWEATHSLDDRGPPAPRPEPAQPALPARPLPEPSSYSPGTNRTDRFLASNPAPRPPPAASHRPSDYSTTTEVDLENQRRAASQAKTKAGGWASKSLLEREMERERERQREWEESQQATSAAAKDSGAGSGPGQSWDVHQYGYIGGDSQNRGGPGLGVGGARRQIIGPRPPPR